MKHTTAIKETSPHYQHTPHPHTTGPGAVAVAPPAYGIDVVDHSPTLQPKLTIGPVNDQYEPGSTFKMVVTAAALEEGLVSPDTTFTLGRDIQVYDRVVHESHAESVPEKRELTVPQILAQSSNVGAVQLGLEVGKTRLVEMIRQRWKLTTIFPFSATSTPSV